MPLKKSSGAPKTRFEKFIPKPRLPELSFHKILPNLITICALSAGITAIRFAHNGSFEWATTAILIAALLDGLDGRIARLLKGTSKFGAELDSLSDFICFGVAPALTLYFWSLKDVKGIGWALCLLLAICCALRLARFNTSLIESERKPSASKATAYFTGVPAPAGAGLVLLPFFMTFEFPELSWIMQTPVVTGSLILIVSLLMVSTIPTLSLKGAKIAKEYVLPFFIGVALFIGLFLHEPWLVLVLLFSLYLLLIPFIWIHSRRQRVT